MKLNNLYTLDDFKLERNYIRTGNALFEGVAEDLANNIEKVIIPKKIHEVEKHLFLSTLKALADAEIGVKMDEEFEQKIKNYIKFLQSKDIKCGVDEKENKYTYSLTDNNPKNSAVTESTNKELSNYIEKNFEEIKSVLNDKNKVICEKIIKGADDYINDITKKHSEETGKESTVTPETKSNVTYENVKDAIKNKYGEGLISNYIIKIIYDKFRTDHLNDKEYTDSINRINEIIKNLNDTSMGDNYKDKYKNYFLTKEIESGIIDPATDKPTKKEVYSEINKDYMNNLDIIKKINNVATDKPNEIPSELLKIINDDNNPIKENYSYLNDYAIMEAVTSSKVGNILPKTSGDTGENIIDPEYKYVETIFGAKSLSDFTMGSFIEEFKKYGKDKMMKKVKDNINSQILMKLYNEVENAIDKSVDTEKGEISISPDKKDTLMTLWKDKINKIFNKYSVVASDIITKNPFYIISRKNEEESEGGGEISKEQLDYLNSILDANKITKVTGNVHIIGDGALSYSLLRISSSIFFNVNYKGKLVEYHEIDKKTGHKLPSKLHHYFYVGGFLDLRQNEKRNTSTSIIDFAFKTLSDLRPEIEYKQSPELDNLKKDNYSFINNNFYLVFKLPNPEPNSPKPSMEIFLINVDVNPIEIIPFNIKGNELDNTGYLGAYRYDIPDLRENPKCWTKEKQSDDPVKLGKRIGEYITKYFIDEYKNKKPS